MRFVSLTAISAASRIVVTPSANAPATASTGSSSMIASCPEISIPCSGAASTVIVPTGSPTRVSVDLDLDVRAHLAAGGRGTRCGPG